MTIKNAWVFTETIFNAEKFLTNTGNIYQFSSQQPYIDKKDPTVSGVTLSLLITKDSTNYGNDKKTGFKRDDNRLNSFDVTILNNKNHIDLKKGEYVRLIEFMPNKSYVIGFDLILRFKDVEKINVQTK